MKKCHKVCILWSHEVTNCSIGVKGVTHHRGASYASRPINLFKGAAKITMRGPQSVLAGIAQKMKISSNAQARKRKVKKKEKVKLKIFINNDRIYIFK